MLLLRNQPPKLNNRMPPLPILLYDGPCTLCHKSVQFILHREKKAVLHFSPLESELGTALRDEYAVPRELDAVVLIDEAGATWGSDAAFRICRYLKAPWSWLAPLRHLPSFLFQGIYSFVANRREKWFGRDETCPIPDPDQADRFV